MCAASLQITSHVATTESIYVTIDLFDLDNVKMKIHFIAGGVTFERYYIKQRDKLILRLFSVVIKSLPAIVKLI